ncbi:MAG: hypothetical protein MJK04_36560 [Psychrosphaera sp.]|nr:hypothetical protein [Psychrosphaera sp.]
MKLLSIFIMFVVSFEAGACTAMYIPMKDRVHNASQITIGYVTGLRNLSFENHLRKNQKTANLEERVTSASESYEMRVMIKETLKGKAASANSAIFAVNTKCAAHSNIRDKVIVFVGLDDELPYLLGAEYLSDVQKALTKTD